MRSLPAESLGRPGQLEVLHPFRRIIRRRERLQLRRVERKSRGLLGMLLLLGSIDRFARLDLPLLPHLLRVENCVAESIDTVQLEANRFLRIRQETDERGIVDARSLPVKDRGKVRLRLASSKDRVSRSMFSTEAIRERK